MIDFDNYVQIYKKGLFFPTDFRTVNAFPCNFCVENSCREKSLNPICSLKRMSYDADFFAILEIICTFAAPQNMQGVVTS